MNKFKFVSSAALLLAFQATFAQGGLSKECINEILDIPSKNKDFVFGDFIKSLPTTVVKIKGQAKASSIPLFGSLLGPGSDDKVTDLGITVGCVKAFPESPGELQVVVKDIGLGMAKGMIASKLGVAREDVPSDLEQLKNFAVKMGREKAGEALGVEASEIPTNLKGLEAFASNELKEQAVSKLGVAKGDIPKDKSQLAPFVEKAAKKKIANELKIKSSEIDFSPKGLQNIANERQDLVPVVNMMKAANLLSTFSMVSALDFSGKATDAPDEKAVGGKTKTSGEETAQSYRSEEKEYTSFHIDWDEI